VKDFVMAGRSKKKKNARAYFTDTEWIECKAVADVFGVTMNTFVKGASLEIARATRAMAEESATVEADAEGGPEQPSDEVGTADAVANPNPEVHKPR
jgi:hypothetical protein